MKSVPFYANDDDKHCFQASMLMILKYFLPDREFSIPELDALSAKLPGKSTWPQQMLINLADMGFDVTMVEAFDGEAFIKEGEAYLRREFGGEAAEWQIKNSDIAQEQRLYKELLAKPEVRVEKRFPELSEINQALDSGYLVNCVVNMQVLNDKPGYVGHSIVVFDVDDTTVRFHDPGLPAQAHRAVSLEAFEKAWADPNETAKNYIAIKLKEPTHV